MSKEKFRNIIEISFSLLLISFGLYIMITNLIKGNFYTLQGVSGCFLFSGGLNVGFLKIIRDQENEIKKLKEEKNKNV